MSGAWRSFTARSAALVSDGREREPGEVERGREGEPTSNVPTETSASLVRDHERIRLDAR